MRAAASRGRTLGDMAGDHTQPVQKSGIPGADSPLPRRGSIARRIVLLALITTLLSTALVGWLGYRAETQAAYRGVESRLRAMAAAVPEVVPAGYHARARAGEVDDAEFSRLLDRLSRLAREADVAYLYTCVRDGDQIRFGASSASDEELATGDWSKLMEQYREPPPELLAVFDDGAPRLASYSDEYGSFRSIFVARGEGPDRHVIGVDVALGDLAAIARGNLLRYLAVGALVGLAVSLVGAWAGRRIAAPIVRLAGAIRTFGEGGFTEDAGSSEELRRLVDSDRTETGELAHSFLAMRSQLVEHVRTLTEVTAEKERMSSQLNIARRIQRGLLPTTAPTVPGFEIAGWSEAADQTGGDYYDWSLTPDGQLIVTIADVTGHGIGPAIMASVCRAYARATLRGSAPLTSLLEQLNRLVHADTRGEQFVTFLAGVLDPAERTMLVASAGHGPVLLHRADGSPIEELATQGVPLGIMDDMSMDPVSVVRFSPGDVLLLISDGFFEWMDVQGQQFGIERLADALRSAASLPPSEIIESIHRAVVEFTAGTEQPDDMTAVVVKCVE